MTSRLVIVGNGMVGLRFVEEIAATCADRFNVTVVGAEPEPAYNRVLLSSLLAGESTDADCRFRDRQWYLRHGVRLIAGAPATKIDLEEQELIVGEGTVVPFDHLVLATGSEPVALPLPGAELPGVRTFRTIGDVRAIQAGSVLGNRAIVIGGGLLGLEAAYGLARAGVATTVLHLMGHVMERQLDARAAALVQNALAARGVDIRLQAQTAAIEGEGACKAVRLADGTRIPADLVVVAAGVRPAAALARACGIAVGRGVKVDGGLRSSVHNVYAIGECCEHEGTAYGLVEPGYEQARILARRFAGDDVSYSGSVLATNLKVSGLPVFSAGDIGDDGNVLRLSDPAMGIYKKLLIREGKLAGCVLVGDTADGLWYLDLIRSGASVSAIRDSIIFGRSLAEDPPVAMREAA